MSFFENYGLQNLYEIDQDTPIDCCLMVSDAAEPEDINLFWKESIKECGIFYDRKTLFPDEEDDYFLFLFDGLRIVGALAFTISCDYDYPFEYEEVEDDELGDPEGICIYFSVKRIAILEDYRGYGLSNLLKGSLVEMIMDERLIPYFKSNPYKDLPVEFHHYSDYASPEGKRWSIKLCVLLKNVLGELSRKGVLPKITYNYEAGI